MMMVFINNLDPVLFSLGPVSVRWYGLLFAIGIFLNYMLLQWVFKREKISVDKLDSVVIYLFFGLLLGARFGHILFYDAAYYFNNPVEIFKIWNGGLASHGAAIGVLIAYFIWTKVHKVKFSKYTDLLVLGMPITAGFVRIGNFFNSEIIGRATDGTWGVIFKRLNEDFPRHPSQFYESGLSFAIFGILFWVYLKYNKKTPPMFIMFLYVLLYFSTRFIVEFWKERHVLPTDFPLSMGQLLSIIPVFIALVYFGILFKKRLQSRS